MELSVIIVSYNTADQIGPCLSALAAAPGGPREIIVVDNASIDGSAAFIGQNFPDVRLLANEKNRGFAAANNQALPSCRGKYILFLNPDTVVQGEALERMRAFMEDHPRVGLAGAHIVNDDGSPQESVSYRYPGGKYAREELAGLQGPIACVLGAAMIARRECLEQVGGFDEDFFLYGEDQDLCLRIRKRGYEIGYIPAAVVAHRGGQSERRTTPAEVWRKKIRAEYLFYRKHYRPQTIRRITRAYHFKTSWRLATLRMLLPFAQDKARAQGKLVKYQVIQQEVKNFALWKEDPR